MCKKLAFEFLNKRLGPALFDRLLWIPLRRLKTREEYGWKDLIQDAHLLQNSKWKQVKAAYADQFYSDSFLNRSLLLFDGLDEVVKQDDRMFEFLESIICDSPNIIITSRPQAKSMDIGRFDLELETTGFLPDQIHAYIKNCTSNPESIKDMTTFISMRPLIQGLLRIPIQLDAFCCSWPSLEGRDTTSREGISTMTTLYHSISFDLCRKDIGRRKSSGRLQKLTNFEVGQVLKTELKLLGELAFQGLMNGIVEYSPGHLEKIASHAFRNGLQLSESYMSVLDKVSFMRTSDVEQDQSKRRYHFLHLTFQEFFAARHFVEHWQNDILIDVLQLSSSIQVEKVYPFRFLQLRKYDPRLNIFWRFVTGLTQILSENKDVVTFFANLEDAPIDIFGVGQARLIMQCLSEVAFSVREDIRQLRLQKERILQRCVMNEYPGGSFGGLWDEVEFPEDILHTFLHDGRDISLTTLGILSCRPSTSIKLLNDIYKILDDSPTPEVHDKLQAYHEAQVYFGALSVACKNFSVGSQEMQRRVIESTRTILKDSTEQDELAIRVFLQGAEDILRIILKIEGEETQIRENIVKLLEKHCWSLNQETISLLATIATNRKEPRNLRLLSLRLLSEQARKQAWAYGSYSSLTGIDQIFAVFKYKDEDVEVRSEALQVISSWTNIPLSNDRFLAILTTAFGWGEHLQVQSQAKSELGTQLCLAAESILFILQSLEPEVSADQTDETTLWKQLSSDERCVIAIVRSLPTIPAKWISTTERYLQRQLVLPLGAVNLLTAMLKMGTESVRICALGVLERQSSLTQETIESLILMLESQDRMTRHHASNILMEQASLSWQAIDKLTRLSSHNNYEIRRYAVRVLASQRCLHRHTIAIVLSILRSTHESSEKMQVTVIGALQNKPDLPEEITSTVLRIVEDGQSWGPTNAHCTKRWLATELLTKQSYLSQDTVVSLLVNTMKSNYSPQDHWFVMEGLVFDLLDKHINSSTLQNIDVDTWIGLYRFWHYGVYYPSSEEHSRISCYCLELDGFLRAYWNGKMLEISDNPRRTQELLQGARDINKRHHEKRVL